MAEQEEGTLGDRVKKLRAAKGISQEGLASLSGLTVSSVAKVEQGKMKNPRLDTLEKLAKALGVKIGTLLGE